jgi:hypothetical protein
MKLIPSQESEYGKFDLIPEEGQKIRHFVDFESKLLVVSESPIDISKIPSQNSWGRIIPTKTYIIAPNQQEILNYQQWKKYFSYEPIETISKDGKLKEVWQRKHEKERNIDSYEGYLIEIQTGKKIIGGASSVAFSETKRISLIERYYQSIEQRKKYLRSLEKGKYPNEKYEEYLNGLLENEIVFQFIEKDEIFQLKKTYQNFSLYSGKAPSTRRYLNTIILENKKEDYENLDKFWNQFSENEKWFQEIKPSKINRVMEKFIITSHNRILEQSEISYEEHKQLHSWMNRCFNREIERNVYWQFCSNCRERVYYYPRYPKHACRNCVNLIKDEFGNELDYRTTHELLVHKLCLKSNQKEVKIFIRTNEYWAEEARFGGIVHQMKEKN